MIREAAVHVILKSLEERTANPDEGKDDNSSARRGRKDMLGITPELDEGATKKLLARRTLESDKLSEHRDACISAKHVSTIMDKARLSNVEKKLLKCILTGSPRSPSRLWASMKIGTGRCTHPACQGCIADLEHVLWKCPRYHSTRQTYAALMDDYIERLRRKTPSRARELEDMMNRPCFRNCGLCVAANEASNVTDALQQDDPLLDDITENTLTRAEDLEPGEDGYITAYPDGSAVDTQSRHTARAGWAVHYKEGSRSNAAEALRGPTKSSYRAEVRAIAHIVSTCVKPTHIKSDCKSAVTLFNRLNENRAEEIGEWPESDLWERIRNRLPKGDNTYTKCTWIPSHLGEPGNEAKLQAAIASGIITSEDVRGNDAADSMAKEMLKREELSPQILNKRRDRQAITTTTQYMMVKVWWEHLQHTFHGTDQTEIDEGMPFDLGIAQEDLRELEMLDDFYEGLPGSHGIFEDADDYDPFGWCDLNGNDERDIRNAKRDQPGERREDTKRPAILPDVPIQAMASATSQLVTSNVSTTMPTDALNQRIDSECQDVVGNNLPETATITDNKGAHQLSSLQTQISGQRRDDHSASGRAGAQIQTRSVTIINGPEDLDIYRSPLSNGGIIISAPARQNQLGDMSVAIKVDHTDGSANNKLRRVMVSLITYNAVREWLTSFRWSLNFKESSGRPADHDVTHYTVTWMELLADYSAISSSSTALPGNDVEDQAGVLRMVMKKICRLGHVVDLSGKNFSYASFFEPAPHVHSLKWVTGLRLPGLMRRPLWEKERTRRNYIEMIKIFKATPQAAGFGRGCNFGKQLLAKAANGPNLSWSTHGRLAPLAGPCVHGHSVTSALDNGRPRWCRYPNDVGAKVPSETGCWQARRHSMLQMLFPTHQTTCQKHAKTNHQQGTPARGHNNADHATHITHHTAHTSHRPTIDTSCNNHRQHPQHHRNDKKCDDNRRTCRRKRLPTETHG